MTIMEIQILGHEDSTTENNNKNVIINARKTQIAFFSGAIADSLCNVLVICSHTAPFLSLMVVGCMGSLSCGKVHL